MAEPRVVVIGAGAAGCAAALAAAELGARVTVARAALGATALSSGAVDLAADPVERPGDPWEGRPSLEEAYRRCRNRGPHPLDRAAVSAADAHAILERLASSLPCLEMASLEAPARVLPTDMGTFKSTALASPWATPGHLPDLAGKRVGVVGIAGHPQHQASGLVGPLGALARRGGVELELHALEMPLLRLRGEELAGAVDLARLVERPGNLDRICAWLAERAADMGLDFALLPPVMGMERWAEVRQRITAALPAAELLAASPPTVPGLRLVAALDLALEAAGVRRVQGRVSALETRAGRVVGADLAGGRRLEGDSFVLATGRFIGGGLVHEQSTEEGVLEAVARLPVWIGREGPGVRAPGKFMDRAAPGPHPLMSAGLRVDQGLRPLGPGGQPAADNLFAAGSVVGGYDYITGRDGLGTALITGHLAGLGAAQGGAS